MYIHFSFAQRNQDQEASTDSTTHHIHQSGQENKKTEAEYKKDKNSNSRTFPIEKCFDLTLGRMSWKEERKGKRIKKRKKERRTRKRVDRGWEEVE